MYLMRSRDHTTKATCRTQMALESMNDYSWLIEYFLLSDITFLNDGHFYVLTVNNAGL